MPADPTPKPAPMIDLHCHSNISDGALPPQEVVRQAHAQGCTLLMPDYP